MIILNGIGIFKDISFGTLSIDKKSYEKVKKRAIEDVESEIERYEVATQTALKETEDLYQKALKKLGENEALIFRTHEMMIKDEDYCSSVIQIIKNQKVNAEYAVWETCEKFCKVFSDCDDVYMQNRAIDVRDISDCLIDCLSGCKKVSQKEEDNIIIAAKDLTPSEVSCLDKNKVHGFITSRGSDCSHTAILAKVMSIPAVVGLGDQIQPEYDGCEIIIDSFSGKVYVNPDDATVKKFKKKKKQCETRKELLRSLKGKENITKDGQKIDIFANVNDPSQIDEVLSNDPGGIGLFRSEFLYLNRSTYPTEDEQFEVYKNIVQKMEGKRVIIRTLDIGSDKRAEYFNLPNEDNPAMGYRGVRVCLDRTEIFMTQLRAIYRASFFGNVSIMFPMIISVREIIQIKKYIETAKKDLKNEKIPFCPSVKIGIMIETPAAALISDDLAKEVDFFSIGTNDLTQYSLAVDRQNSKVNSLFEPRHKSILRMIKIVVDNAHKQGIDVGICGEIASDDSLTETFLSMGVNELSMSAPFILGVRKKVIESDISKIRHKILKSLNQ